MEASSNFKQAGDAAVQLDATGCRMGDARKNFEQRGLPCSITAYYADDFALFDLKGDILEGPDDVGIGRWTVDGGRWVVAVGSGLRPVGEAGQASEATQVV